MSDKSSESPPEENAANPSASQRPARNPVAELSGKQRAFLRGMAHHSKPVVQIGKQGLIEAITSQVIDALHQHELIKVRVNEKDMKPKEIAPQLAEQSGAHLAGTIGRNILLYRRRDRGPKPRIDIKNLSMHS